MPPSPYIKEWRRGGPALYYGAPWGVLLPPGVSNPFVGSLVGEELDEIHHVIELVLLGRYVSTYL